MSVPHHHFHRTAIVETADIGAGTRIWAYAHVLPGARIGENCNVGDHVFIEGGAVIGDNVTIKNQVCIWDGVTIEDDVFVGPQVMFTNDKYPRSPRMAAVQARYARADNWMVSTLVRQGCSIGAHATILPGIRLGAYSMIAAGSVVTRDVDDHALVAGNPGRKIGSVCRCGGPLDACRGDSLCPECRRAGHALS